VVEGAVADLELPGSVPLRAPRGGEPVQRGVVGDLDGVALDDDVQAAVPVIAPGGEGDVRVRAQVDGLLFGGAGAEVEGAVEPDGRERGDVRPSVGTDGGDPEQLSGLDHPQRVVPGGRCGARFAEPGVE